MFHYSVNRSAFNLDNGRSQVLLCFSHADFYSSEFVSVVYSSGRTGPPDHRPSGLCALIGKQYFCTLIFIVTISPWTFRPIALLN